MGRSNMKKSIPSANMFLHRMMLLLSSPESFRLSRVSSVMGANTTL